MATYKDVRDEVRRRHGRSVETCWIADIREKNGLPVRKAWNRNGARKKPCPTWARPLIEDAMRRLGIL